MSLIDLLKSVSDFRAKRGIHTENSSTRQCKKPFLMTEIP